MTLGDKVQAQRHRLFRRAAELGNVSAACRGAGISRSLYYELKGRLVRYGPYGLHPKRAEGGRGGLPHSITSSSVGSWPRPTTMST